jgi:hypothetical protein
MIKYRYKVDENTTTETFYLSDIPKNTPYESIDEVLVDDDVIILDPTKNELIQKVQELQEQLIEVKQQLNNL